MTHKSTFAALVIKYQLTIGYIYFPRAGFLQPPQVSIVIEIFTNQFLLCLNGYNYSDAGKEEYEADQHDWLSQIEY
jgi:hypothetical protein